MRYEIRDPNSGQFTKVTREEFMESAMTIDEKGEEVTVRMTEQGEVPQVPSNLPITGDEGMIRGNMSKIADYIVQMSGWAKKFEEMNKMKEDLERGLAEALERARQAELLSSQAIEAKDRAEESARMAREAYKVVSNERDHLDALNKTSEKIITDLQADVSLQAGENAKLKEELETEKGALEVARKEVATFREAHSALQTEIANVKRDWASRYEELSREYANLKQDRDSLSAKADALTSSNQRLIEEISAQKNKWEGLKRQMLQ